jgi:hypothetical protein
MYAYSYETNSVSKWDTIQEDVKDQYTYLDEVEVEAEDEGDVFGFSKAIELDHLTDEQLDEVFSMFGDK